MYSHGGRKTLLLSSVGILYNFYDKLEIHPDSGLLFEKGGRGWFYINKIVHTHFHAKVTSLVSWRFNKASKIVWHYTE